MNSEIARAFQVDDTAEDIEDEEDDKDEVSSNTDTIKDIFAAILKRQARVLGDSDLCDKQCSQSG